VVRMDLADALRAFDLLRWGVSYKRVAEIRTKLHVSCQEQWLDSTGPFKDLMVSMFATLAKQERPREYPSAL
jgi:threonine synthase